MGRAAGLSSARQGEANDSPAGRLVARFDDYLLGWRDRDLVLDPAHRRSIHPGGGIINAAFTIDGAVRGTWQLTRRGKRLAIAITPFGMVTRAETARITADAEDVARFLGRADPIVQL